MPTLDDKTLLKQARQGSRDAIRCIYEEYKAPLLTLANALLHDRQTAEDVVHDVFVGLARGLQNLRLRGSLKAYLSVGVCNRVRDLIRAKARARANCNPVSLPDRIAEAPDAILVQQEHEDRLRAALAELPLEQREVLLLRARMDMTFGEIAQHQGVSINTTQGRYRYGIERLRSLLETELRPCDRKST